MLIPNSKTYGISKRLPDDVRKRLRGILDRVKPAQHGLIVRTAAEHATEEELRADMTLLLDEWETDRRQGGGGQAADAAVPRAGAGRAGRSARSSTPTTAAWSSTTSGCTASCRPTSARSTPSSPTGSSTTTTTAEGLSLFEQYHVHEQVHKALDRKVWLPSGGSLIIEHTEALTVIDVNTGKNVGTSSLEETVFHNNMEAADEIAKQLRLRDIGGIIVIDFIDMENRANRAAVVERFRNALSRDKTRSQVFDISDLGLVEMTRKRIGEGLLTEFSEICPECEGRGVIVDHALLD